MGAAGPAIIFVCALAGAVIIAVYVLTFSASALLLVVEHTAAGNDEVPWPSEPWADILARAVYLAMLLGLWMIPAGFLSNALRDTWLPGQPAIRLLLIALPGLWLFFPVGLFSSLTSLSGWVFLRWQTLRDLVRVWPATLLFYAASACLASLVAAFWLLTLSYGGLFLVLAAPFTSYAWLVYARLLGRLALKVGRLKPIKGKKKKADRKPRPEERAVAVTDPWATPGHDEPEQEPEPEPVKQPRPAWLDPEPEPYELSDEAPPPRDTSVPLDGYDPEEAEELAPAEPGVDRIDSANRAVTDRDRRLTRRKKPARLPTRPMLEGILTFPFYPRCIGPLINVAFGWALLGILMLVMLQFNPL